MEKRRSKCTQHILKEGKKNRENFKGDWEIIYSNALLQTLNTEMAQCHSRFCLGIPYVHGCKTWGGHQRFLCNNFHLIALWSSTITKILGYSTPSTVQRSLTFFYVVAKIIWRNGGFLSIVWHSPAPYKTEFRTIESKYYVQLLISFKPKILYDIHAVWLNLTLFLRLYVFLRIYKLAEVFVSTLFTCEMLMAECNWQRRFHVTGIDQL